MADLASTSERSDPRGGALRAALVRMSPSGQVGLAVLLGYFLVGTTGPLWAPYSPTEIAVGMPFGAPSAAHLFGTDELGRDIFSRVVHGTQAVLLMSLSAAALAVVLGSLLGILMGYMRGWTDELVMRAVDIIISMPPLIFALLAIGSLGRSSALVVLVVAFLFAPRVARVVRAATLAIVTEDYVTAAVCRGESSFSIAVRELLPNVAGTVFVEFSIRCGFAIMFIGGLGFLGFGAPPPTPEWGLMINEGRNSINASLWPVLAPAIAMAVLVIAINLFTEGAARVIGGGSQAVPR